MTAWTRVSLEMHACGLVPVLMGISGLWTMDTCLSNGRIDQCPYYVDILKTFAGEHRNILAVVLAGRT